jgi:hypothetical protein
MMFLRALAIISGIALVASAAYASLAHVEAGFTSPYGVITLAVAGGLIVGALCVGAAWSVGRLSIAVAIAVGMLCGELYALILTGERIVSTREAAQVLIREAVERRQAAIRHVGQAEAILAATHRSDRLERALAAKAAADRAVVEKSAERGCASNCRALLQGQVDAAQRDVDAAIVEQEGARERAGRAVKAAQAELAAIGLPPSSSPLAARLGLPAWALDLAAAGLASLAINGLGAALLAFGAHNRVRDPEPTALAAASGDMPPIVQPPKQRLIAAPRDGLAHVAKFAVEVMQPDPEGATSARQIRATYLRWCGDRGYDPLPARDMADRLAALCDKAGLQVDSNGGDPVIRGIRLVA